MKSESFLTLHRQFKAQKGSKKTKMLYFWPASVFYIRTLASTSAALHACIVLLLWTRVEDWHSREDILLNKVIMVTLYNKV